MVARAAASARPLSADRAVDDLTAMSANAEPPASTVNVRRATVEDDARRIMPPQAGDHGGLTHSPDAVALWTGGKDSVLAYRKALRMGLRVGQLVTFTPRNGSFRAHPLPFMRDQASSLGLRHRLIPIAAPYAPAYEAAFRMLKSEGVEAVVSGDIGPVEDQPNWIVERASPAGVRVVRPLWGVPSGELLGTLVRDKIDAVISAVRVPPLLADFVGQSLDPRTIARLRDRSTLVPFDLCGEQGEYHTIVRDAPGFSRPVDLGSFDIVAEGDLHYARFRGR